MSSAILRFPRKSGAAEQFLAQIGAANRLSKSALEPWADDIEFLVDRGCTLAEVRGFLAQQGVTVGITGISAFRRRRAEKKERLAEQGRGGLSKTFHKRKAVRTLGSVFSDAEICRCNHWESGTRLLGKNSRDEIVIEITAVGHSHILARQVTLNGKPVSAMAAREMVWSLVLREWKEERISVNRD